MRARERAKTCTDLEFFIRGALAEAKADAAVKERRYRTLDVNSREERFTRDEGRLLPEDDPSRGSIQAG